MSLAEPGTKYEGRLKPGRRAVVPRLARDGDGKRGRKQSWCNELPHWEMEEPVGDQAPVENKGRVRVPGH